MKATTIFFSMIIFCIFAYSSAFGEFKGEWLELKNKDCSYWREHPKNGESITWSGDCKNGKAHGYGELSISMYLKLDRTIIGNLAEGKLQGKATIKYAKGAILQAKFIDSKIHGKSIMKYPDGSIKETEHENGNLIRVLRYTWADGAIYQGDWKDGKLHGKGIMKLPDGGTYEGDWHRGKANGKGLFKHADGTIYEGDFRHGKMNGKGLLKLANGTIYEGDFSDDEKHGKGIENFTDGTVFKGEFRHGKRHGKGVLMHSNGKREISRWADDVVVQRIFDKEILKLKPKTITGIVYKAAPRDGGELEVLLPDGDECQIGPINKDMNIKAGDQLTAEIKYNDGEISSSNTKYICKLTKLLKIEKPQEIITGQLKKKIFLQNKSEYMFVIEVGNKDHQIYGFTNDDFNLFKEGDTVKFRFYQEYYSRSRSNSEPVNYRLYEIDPQFKADAIKIKEKAYAKYVKNLKSGNVEIQTVQEAVLKFDASNDTLYTRQPPVLGSSKKNKYFVWSGKLVKIEDSLIGGEKVYIAWEAKVNPFYEGLAQFGVDLLVTKGFAFKQIKEVFGEINMNSEVIVVGRYIENMKIRLISGEERLIPVLTDCYLW